jgi:PBSX family phage terminase large subunit
MDIVYKASPTCRSFHKSNKFVRALMGPIGSGKSVACVVDLMIKAYEQKPSPDGIRRTRWAIIRNTYRELLDTTMQTFHDWIPVSTGVFSAMNLKFTHIQKLPDGTTVQAEFLFRALDRPNDVKKLLSLELTGSWVNEAREIPKQIIDMLQGRVGRYPNMRDGGATWFGIIMDTNPPDNDHWWYKLFEESLPDNHFLAKQPSGTSRIAENISNLPPNYYTNMQGGKDQEWINVYVHGNYGFIADGKPVFPEYKDDVHSSQEPYFADPKLPLYIGIDFGLTPAAVFGQLTTSGRMIIFDELCTFDMGAMSFGKLLREKLNTTYSKFLNVEIYADPAGEQRAQTDESTPFMILHNQGIEAYPTYTNDFTIRREAVADYMQRLDFAGNTAFLITGKATTLRKALSGGYKYKRMQVSGEARFMDKPDKGRYSHVADACQYLFLGAVGGSRVIGGFDSKPIDYTLSNLGVI